VAQEPAPGAPPEPAFWRLACCEPCQLETANGETRQGVVWNVSAQGVYVLLQDPLPEVGETFRVSFSLPGDTVGIGAQATVMWQNQMFFQGGGEKAPRLPPGCGLKFVDLQPADEARILARVRDLFPGR
jgi:PilZ domain-containing protein